MLPSDLVLVFASEWPGPEEQLPHYVVVGAGVAGLTIARRLAAERHAVTIVERDSVVGGLAQ